VPINKMMARFQPQEPEPQVTRECPECLSKIPVKATRCAFCSTEVAAVA
jgi:large conductance mechanosensitive channel